MGSEAGPDRYVRRCIEGFPDLRGKTVIDVPCGAGRASEAFSNKGAKVIAFDLFPEFMKAPGIEAIHADMSERLPVDDGCADYVVCQEGIEHVPDQVALLAEFNRVLKVGGVLLLTTPSISHVRARLAQFLFETDSMRRMPPTELDSVWFAADDAERIYYGHLFQLGVHKLTALVSISGFAVQEHVQTKFGVTSTVLGVLLYPLFAVATLATYRRCLRKGYEIPAEVCRPTWWEHVKLNLSPRTLFCKHNVWLLRKDYSIAEKRSRLQTGRWER